MVISQNANCFDGTVTEVVDGDTLDVNNVRIRLALIDAPEKNETGYSEARHFVESLCKVGTQAKVDETTFKINSFDKARLIVSSPPKKYINATIGT